jgi:integrase
MARKVRDAALDSREARSKLKPRGKLYMRAIERAAHLGYRRIRGRAGSWWGRFYVGDKTYQVESIGAADDLSDADGVAILTYWQAIDAVRKRREERAHTASGKITGPYTVADAMDAYFEFLKSEGRTDDAIDDAKYRDRAFIRPKLGDLEVASLTADKLRQWRDGLAGAASRLRTKPGEKQKHRKATGEDAKRARRASVNRVWTVLRAALNRAFQTDRVNSDQAWRKVKPFKSVDKARVRYLTIAEAKRLINACDPDFRKLIRGALLTGGRYGGLTRSVVADFNPDAATLRLTSRKGDGSMKVFHIHLTEEGEQFFRQACAGKASTDLIFVRNDGTAWGKSHQQRPIIEASERAKIDPPANFNVTRHTYASHSVMNGVPLMVVAKNLGHTDTRMVELHYGHLAPGYVADAIRAGAPKFGFKPDRKIATL